LNRKGGVTFSCCSETKQKKPTMTDIPSDPSGSPNADPDPRVQQSSDPNGTGGGPQIVIDPNSDAVGTEASE
jgi:hypothetical protein